MMRVEIQATTADAYRLFHDGILALARAEREGIRVDVEYCNRKREHLTRKIEYFQKQLEDTKLYRHWQHVFGVKTNIYSNQQLSHLLYKRMKLEPIKTTESGQGATDEDALKRLNIPGIDLLLKIRKLSKVKGTYLEAFMREQTDGYMHPSFNLHNVRTYRSSSANPNFQNIPKRDEEAMKICRRAILPRPGHMLVEADFSSLEVNVSECVTGDTKIETIDGAQSIRQIIWKVNNGENIFVYGYDLNEERIKIAPVIGGGITRRKAEVWKVVLDNGQEIIATPDHSFLLRNGVYIKLRDLSPGMSLMPFYKKKVKSSYGTVYEDVNLNNGKRIRAHNLIAQDIYGIKIAGSDKIVHHKNGNGCDNSLTNLEIITRKRHMQIHSVQGWKNKPAGTRGHWMKTEEGRAFAKMVNERRKEEWDEYDWARWKKKISETRLRKGLSRGENNPMYGKKHSKETKEKISKTKTDRPQSDKWKSWNKGLTKETDERIARIALRTSEANKGRIPWNTGIPTSEAIKKKIQNALKGRKFSDDWRKKLSKNKKEYWKKKKENGKKEKCLICGKEFISITNTHLLHKHGITIEEYKNINNHKVVSIEFYGYKNVYNIDVKGIHNYALSAGIIIKNCYHKDPVMMKYLLDKKSDMHLDMAKQIYMLDEMDKKNPIHATLRQGAKNGFVFPQFYGDYYGNNAYSLCEWAKLPTGRWKDGQGLGLPDGTPISTHLRSRGVKSFDQFTEHMKKVEDDFWNRRFKEYGRWRDHSVRLYRKRGWLRMHTGFVCSGIMRKNEIMNYPIQGSAFHCLLFTFIELDKIMRKEKWTSRIIGQIHDSILLDADPKEMSRIKEALQIIVKETLPTTWKWIIVPLEIEVDEYGVDKPWIKA